MPSLYYFSFKCTVNPWLQINTVGRCWQHCWNVSSVISYVSSVSCLPWMSCSLDLLKNCLKCRAPSFIAPLEFALVPALHLHQHFNLLLVHRCKLSTRSNSWDSWDTWSEPAKLPDTFPSVRPMQPLGQSAS